MGRGRHHVTGGGRCAPVLQGKRFFRAEFGIDLTSTGCPSLRLKRRLPQNLRLAGVETFSTQKLSGASSTPSRTRPSLAGIDGTTVQTQCARGDQQQPAAPRSVRRIERTTRCRVSSHALMVLGIGSAAAVRQEHLERLAHRDLAGLSPVKPGWAADFLKEWRTESNRFATWNGELYLERHEGTLTTEARNKWYNRKMELGLRELEWSAALAARLAGAPYPAETLTTLWREVLLYQSTTSCPAPPSSASTTKAWRATRRCWRKRRR